MWHSMELLQCFTCMFSSVFYGESLTWEGLREKNSSCIMTRVKELLIYHQLWIINVRDIFSPKYCNVASLFEHTHKHTKMPSSTNTPTGSILSPPSPSLSFCSVRQVNSNNKITLCISSVLWMASSIYSCREILWRKWKKKKKGRGWGIAQGNHPCLKYLRFHSMHLIPF